jgi:hypothetical protein
MIVWATINGIEASKAERQLNKEGKFTLATITDIEGAKSGRWVEVEFLYNGSKYSTKRRNEMIPHSWIGEKIFIKFLPSRPVVTEYYENIDVPDSISSLSPTIWDSLPLKLYSSE